MRLLNDFVLLITVCAIALLPLAAACGIFWAALEDGRRFMQGETRRWFWIRGRHP